MLVGESSECGTLREVLSNYKDNSDKSEDEHNLICSQLVYGRIL